MNPYVISVEGCDDSTHALVDMTESQAAWLQHVIGIINGRSQVSCQPTILLRHESEADSYDRERATEEIAP